MFDNSPMKIFAAPLQGYTDAVFRHWHSELFGGADAYFTPFLRVEKGEPATRTLRDINSPLNCNCVCVPQIIFGNAGEFTILKDALVEAGHRNIDLNLGCPFPPQVHKGRGAGFLRRIEELEKVARIIEATPDVRFSLKIRLGVEIPDEWRCIMPQLCSMRPEHITVHPRTARQQYRGDLHMDEFAAFYELSTCPVVYNGEIRDLEDYENIVGKYPGLYGVMIGRGLLGRPSLAVEIKEGCSWSEARRNKAVLELHDRMLQHYSATLCGEAQILSRIKAFWEYMDLPGRTGKNIAKARTMANYTAAVADIWR